MDASFLGINLEIFGRSEWHLKALSILVVCQAVLDLDPKKRKTAGVLALLGGSQHRCSTLHAAGIWNLALWHGKFWLKGPSNFHSSTVKMLEFVHKKMQGFKLDDNFEKHHIYMKTIVTFGKVLWCPMVASAESQCPPCSNSYMLDSALENARLTHQLYPASFDRFPTLFSGVDLCW